MEHHTATTVPVKLALSGSKRRSRLNVPLRFSQLCQQVRSTFPDIKDFNLQYVDEEGDTINVTSDEDLEEAHSVFKDLGRVLSFIVDTTTTAAPPPPATAKSCAGRRRYFQRGLADIMRSLGVGAGIGASVPALHFGVTCDGSNQHPIVGTRYHKIGHNYDLNEAAFAKLTPVEQKTYEAIAHPGAVPVPITLGTTDSEEHAHLLLPTNTPFGPGSSGPSVVTLQKVLIKLGHMHPSAIRWHQGFYGPRTAQAVAKVSKTIGCNTGGVFTDRVRTHLLKELVSPRHHGITCDGSNQHPLVGPRYHKIGHNYDLNEAEFSKLNTDDQKKYEIISQPGAAPVPVAIVADCVFVRDITFPDGQLVPGGKQFKKTWLVKTGATGWPVGCALSYISGNKMSTTSRIVLAPQKPHALVKVSVDLTAPTRPGKATSKWRVTGPDGKLFGHSVWCTIVVAPTKSTVVAKTPAVAASAVTVGTAAAASTVGAQTPLVSPTVPAVATSSPPAALQHLLDMGFGLPVDTLASVLESAHGDIHAAITALFECE